MPLNLWRTAALIACSHLTLVLMTRAEAIALSVSAQGNLVPVAYIFSLLDTLGVLAVLSALLWVSYRSLVLRLASGGVTFLLNAYVVLDGVFFGVFFNHFQLSYADGQISSAAMLRDSFLAEAGPTFWVNFSVLCCFQFFIFRRLLRPHEAPALISRTPTHVALAVTVVLAVAVASLLTPKGPLKVHPLTALVLGGGGATESPTNLSEVADITRLRYGDSPYNRGEMSDLESALARVRGQLDDRARAPNIMFVTLESVGTKQLLKEGRFDASVTPNLHRLAPHMVIFPALYTPFPGTARSHVPLSTGGRTITWGSVFTELEYPFVGPTMEKLMKGAGYATAMFSATDIDYENLDGYYRQQPYDLVFEPAVASPSFRDRHTVNSWGVDERAVLGEAANWLRAQNGAPFFMHFRTVCTHHPYCEPDGYEAAADDRRTRYYNALGFLDDFLGDLMEQLAASALLEDTLVVIVGDHGQAFGEHHPANFTHKNFLYEENIKTFMLVLDVARIKETLVVDRPGSLGDVMPTLASLAGAAPPDVPGHDLFAENYVETIQYFYKGANPAQWGLRDGQWKFISSITGEFTPELYDLSSDPHEQINLAADYPERVQQYHNLAGNWYIRTNDEFVAYLAGFEYVGNRGLSLEQTREYGPKRLAFGIKPADGQFEALAVIHPLETLVAWVHTIPYPTDKRLTYEWISPAGKKTRINFTLKKIWSTAWIGDQSRGPREEGEWRLNIIDGDNVLISGTFTVSDEAKLHRPMPLQGPVELAFGVKPRNGQFEQLAEIHPDEDMVVQMLCAPFAQDTRLDYLWTSPSGAKRKFYFDVKAGWDKVWVKHSAPKSMEAGNWRLQVFYENTELVSGNFDVAPEALLRISRRG